MKNKAAAERYRARVAYLENWFSQNGFSTQEKKESTTAVKFVVAKDGLIELVVLTSIIKNMDSFTKSILEKHDRNVREHEEQMRIEARRKAENSPGAEWDAEAKEGNVHGQ